MQFYETFEINVKKTKRKENRAFCIKKSLKIDQNQFYETMEMIYITPKLNA
jgi:uncharacterized membrane protein YcgQ (UPF0703/DUF1980 family)